MNAHDQMKKKMAKMNKVEQQRLERESAEELKKRKQAEEKKKIEAKKRRAAEQQAQAEAEERKKAERRLEEEKMREQRIKDEEKRMHSHGHHGHLPDGQPIPPSDVRSRRVQQAEERLNTNKIKENKKQQEAESEQIKIGKRYI